jgi:beta-fructofuranosidase
MYRRTFLAAIAAAATASAQKPLEDPHFPRYHFRPPKNWMNDPNGLIYWNGEYHMFYQYNPHAAYWGDMHWGHTVSTDLVHWKPLPLALYPDKPYDKDGVFSGCAVVHDGVPTLVYTGTNPETQCVATTSNNLREFHKLDKNPVISEPPAKVTGFRDPWLWKEGDEWLMALGGGFPDVGGAILLYSSKDLVSWRYLHPLCQGDKSKTGHNWECPNFFPLGERHVLLISAEPFRKVLYFIGRYENRRFTPESEGVFDAGGSLYAPQTFLDKDGRRTLIGWLTETRPQEEFVKAGWSGGQSLPRVLTLRKDRTLGVEPHPNIRTVREPWNKPGAQAEFEATFSRTPAKAELHVGSEVLPIEYSGGSLTVANHSAPMKLDAGEPLRLDIFVDHSVVEVFANGRVAMAIRVYPSTSDPLRLDAPGAKITAYQIPGTVDYA